MTKTYDIILIIRRRKNATFLSHLCFLWVSLLTSQISLTHKKYSNMSERHTLRECTHFACFHLKQRSGEREKTFIFYQIASRRIARSYHVYLYPKCCAKIVYKKDTRKANDLSPRVNEDNVKKNDTKTTQPGINACTLRTHRVCVR